MRTAEDLPAYCSEPVRIVDMDLCPERPFSLLDPLVASSVKITQQNREISQLREINLEEHYKATHDDLTSALNRRGLSEYLETVKSPMAIVMVDATNLKAVNDYYQHARGDEVIISTYKILQESFRPNDIIARIGGDEFVIILSDQSLAKEGQGSNKEKRGLQAATTKEVLEITTRRVAAKTQQFLVDNPDLTDERINFDLAVGSIEWNESASLVELFAAADEAMKIHKDQQHARGQHRKV